jgi:phosphomevalonate kinase
MKARAPGKIVLSGAYAVLEGAPAIASAVDRYAVADSSLTAPSPTPEVRAAFHDAPAPACDASALFGGAGGDKKLGLGASAAILVATLAASVAEERGGRRGEVPPLRVLRSGPGGGLGDVELASAVFSRALAAHAAAQGGGSGVDVAASAFGGTIAFRRGEDRPQALAVKLPSDLTIEVWWSGRPASTSELVGRVSALRERARGRYVKLIDAQAAASLDAELALGRGDSRGFLRALDAQRHALDALGQGAGAPIVDDAARALGDAAAALGGAALPAGAGGGDVLVFAGVAPSDAEFRALARVSGYEKLELSLGARGVHVYSP